MCSLVALFSLDLRNLVTVEAFQIIMEKVWKIFRQSLDGVPRKNISNF